MRKFIHAQQTRAIVKINLAFWSLSFLFNGLTTASNLGDDYRFMWLVFTPTFDEVIYQPWTIFTYAFLHKNLVHLLVNLVGLVLISNMVSKLISAKRIIKVYVVGSIGGALFYGLMSWLYTHVFKQGMMQDHYLLGMTPAVYALWAYVLVQFPRARWEVANFFSISAAPIFWIWMAVEFGYWYLTSDGTRMGSFGGAITGYLMSSYERAFSDMWYKGKKRVTENLPLGVNIRP